MVAVASMPWLSAPRAALAALRARGAHALLLQGPPGTGKWELGLSFARDLLCERAAHAPRFASDSSQHSAGACGTCASCVLLTAGTHPDLHIVVPDAWAERRPSGGTDGDADAASADAAPAAKTKPSREIKIEQVRELLAPIGTSTHRGGARVIVLAPAEALNAPAANALLKALEEPPPAVAFVLISDRIDQCLPTIVSRCALVRVPAPPKAVALAWLKGQDAGLGGLGDAEAAIRLAEAGGGPLAVTAGGASTDETALDASLHAVLTGMLRRGPLLEPVQVGAEVPRTAPIAASVALFQRWAWDYFAYRTGCALRYHPHDAASFDALAPHWSLRAAGAWADSLCELRSLADHPLNARAAVEGALLDYVDSIGALR